MNIKKTTVIGIGCVILILLATILLNYFINPFGIFGDKYLECISYNMQSMPNVAKIEYLEKNSKNYNSYLVGTKRANSIDVEKLDKYMDDAKFYNMSLDGASMKDIEDTSKYILKNYEVKNLVLMLGLEEAVSYDAKANNKNKTKMNNKVKGKIKKKDELNLILKGLFENPIYAYRKLRAEKKDSYLSDGREVYKVEKGYFKVRGKDLESITDKDISTSRVDIFNKKMNKRKDKIKLEDKDKVIQALKSIKEDCDKKGASLTIISYPLYYKEQESYDREDVINYIQELSNVSDLWCFIGYHHINRDERYFYDAKNFRQTVGDMMFHTIFNDKENMIFDDFGVKLTKDSKREEIEKILDKYSYSYDEDDYMKTVPVLMYHHIVTDESETSEYAITVEKFKKDMDDLKNMGYTAIFPQDLIDYVEGKNNLPDRPVLITFDDGYKSNYDYAYPVLKERGMKAVIAVVGSLIGKDKLDGKEIKPHFDYKEAKEMYDNGVIDIALHTYDMHTTDGREGVLKRQDETEKEYVELFKNDTKTIIDNLHKNGIDKITTYAYPHGKFTELQEAIVEESGIRVTLSVRPGMNDVLKGLPQSLKGMKRCNVWSETEIKNVMSVPEKGRKNKLKRDRKMAKEIQLREKQEQINNKTKNREK